MNIKKQLESNKQWPALLSVLQKLHEKNYEAVLAGGAVRDLLLGKNPYDFDIATNAQPEQVEKLFAKTLDVGKKYGTITVVVEAYTFEVTTYRKDGNYSDGRHPEKVEFSEQKEDAARRDFTINSLYFDPFNNKIIDHFGGQKDLHTKLIRCVGEPQQRFAEDKLRMLRAIRFATQLQFSIEEKTLNQIQKKSAEISQVSAERINIELSKMLSHSWSNLAFYWLEKSNLAKAVFPRFKFYEDNNFKDFMRRMMLYHVEDVTSYLMFVCYYENQYCETTLNEVEAQLKSIKFANHIISACLQLCRYVNEYKFNSDDFYLFAKIMDSPVAKQFLEICKTEALHDKKDLKKIETKVQKYLEICNEFGKLPKPLLNGEDLIKYGISAGPIMGEILEKIYRKQILGELKTKAQAMAEIDKLV